MTDRHRLRSPRTSFVLICLVLLVACGGAESRKERYLGRAQALVAEQDFEKAQLELRNALQIDPDYFSALLLMGSVSERLGDPRRAMQMYEAALDQDSSSTAARAGLAKIYVFGGLPEKAVELVEAGLLLKPDDPALLTVRGAARARLGDIPSAIADAEKALAGDPVNENTVALLASLYVKSDRTAEARALVERAVEGLPKSVDLRLILADIYRQADDRPAAEKMLREVVALHPEQTSHSYTLARFLAGSGRSVDAEKVLRDLVASHPDDTQAKTALVSLLSVRESPDAAERELLGFIKQAPKDAQLRLSLGDFYLARGKTADAARIFKEVIDLDDNGPQGLGARNRLAAQAFADKRFDESSQLIEAVLAANSQDNDALVLRAQMALGRGDTVAAITDLRAVLRSQPTSVPVQRALAQAYVQSNDLALAEDTLKKAIAGNPGDPNIRVDLAQLLVRSGEKQRALQTLQDAVAESPENLAAQEQLFVVYAARGDVKSARATAAAVKSARPDLPLGDYLTGLVYRAEGNTAAAIGSFEAALKLKPNGAEPLTALVEALIKSGRTEEALARLATIGKEQPNNSIPHNIRGEVLLAGQRYAEAQVAFDESITLSPSWWVPYRGKAKAQLGAGQAAAAESTYQAGLRATGGALPLGVELAALNESAGQPERAIAEYEKLLERSPTNEVVTNNLAMLLVTYRDDAQSRERAAQLSVRLQKSSIATYVNTAGWVSYRLGRYEEAIPLLRKASEQEPNSPLFRYHLAMAQLKAGQVADAKLNLETALKSNSRFPGDDDARSTLEQLRRS